MHSSVAARSPPSVLFYAPPPAPSPLPPPPRPASTLTFSARAVKGGLPDITSARCHRHQPSQLSWSPSARQPSPRLETERRGREEGRSANRTALPGKLTATYSPSAAISSTKWRPRAGNRRFDHHPPTEGARSGWPHLLVAVCHRPALARSDWPASANLPPPHSLCERPQVEKRSSYWPIWRGPLFRSLASFEDERQTEAPPLLPEGMGSSGAFGWKLHPPKCHCFLLSKGRS